MSREPRQGDILGNYRITGELGRGGMAVVYAAVNRLTEEPYAIKLMQSGLADEEVRSRFQREFRALAQLDHPHVARVFESGIHEDRHYYVMEVLQGHSLKTEIERWRPLPPGERYRRAQRILLQVASALAHIHPRGLVHRDVSPSNIMVLEGKDVKLMDFGVVKEPGTDLTAVGEVVGTIAYISPEQILGEPVDERADLYSLGAVLYLMLTGRRPFHASSLAGYLEKHVNRMPRRPREIAPSVPPLLDEACMRLMAKKPSDRFASAHHLMHFLHAGSGKPVDIRGGRWPRRTVGRAAELAVLRQALHDLEGGQGGVVLVEGGTGTGKTRLVDDLAALARNRGVAVSRGVCEQRVVHAYAGYGNIYDDLQAGADPERREVLWRAFEVEDDSESAPPERYAVYQAFLELMRDHAPRIVVLEDLHRADSGTTELTEYLIRNTLGLSEEPLLFILTRWPVPSGTDPWEGVITGDSTDVRIDRVQLSPLELPAVEDLLLSVVPGDRRAEELAQKLHRESEGNPHFIVEMIRTLVEEGVVEIDDSGAGRLREDISVILREGLPVPPSLRHALRERVQPLSASGRRVAVAVAVAQQEVTAHFLCQITGLDMGHVLGVVDELVEKGVLRDRRVGQEERFDFAEAGLREVLLDDVDEEERRRIHGRIGRALERTWRGRLAPVLDRIALHYEQGDMPAKAYPYLIRAGHHMLRRSFMREALELFDRAMRLEPRARDYMMLDDADRMHANLLRYRARAHAHLGRWEEADDDAVTAHRIAQELEDEALLARTHLEMGAMYRRRTEIEPAEEHFRHAMRLAEETGDTSLRSQAMNRIAGQRWGQGDLDGARTYWLEVLTSADPRSMAAGYGGLGLMAICRGQSAEARKYLEQAVRRYEQIGAVKEAVINGVNLVELYHLVGNLKRALSYADKVLARSREAHLQEGLVLGLRYRALVLVDLARLDEAHDHVEQGLALVRELGTREEELGSYFSFARIAFNRGRPLEAEPWLDKAAAMLERYDVEGLAPIIHAWRARVYAHRGDVDSFRDAFVLSSRTQGRRWPLYTTRVELITAVALADLGLDDQAARRARSALETSEKAGYRFYAFKSHVLLSRFGGTKKDCEHHRRIAESLGRSLAGTLSPEAREAFLELHWQSDAGF